MSTPIQYMGLHKEAPEEASEPTEKAPMGLNEKLARWAGFLPDKRYQAKYGRWEHPETGESIMLGINKSLPFTESVEACNRWLVPKILRTHRIEQFTQFDHEHSRPETMVKLLVWFREHVVEGKAVNTDPALAFCQAVEQLIDSQEE